MAELKPRWDACPKCGETVFTGPVYRGGRSYFNEDGSSTVTNGELEWACARCGWTHSTRPLDYTETVRPRPQIPKFETKVHDGPHVLDWLHRLVS